MAPSSTATATARPLLAAGKQPARSATTATRFAIGSISKQFTAAAILLLAEQGKLSLDDPVARFLPALTAARDITLRDLLGHTSGYQDYFTEEYIPAATQQPTTVDAILKIWGQRSLDFDPGTEWGYSGTNYVIAARIVELASGEAFFPFLQKHILAPVGITDAILADERIVDKQHIDATGYLRFALGPPRLAPKTGPNWLFGMASALDDRRRSRPLGCQRHPSDAAPPPELCGARIGEPPARWPPHRLWARGDAARGHYPARRAPYRARAPRRDLRVSRRQLHRPADRHCARHSYQR